MDFEVKYFSPARLDQPNMPSKIIQCEFCDLAFFRKDRYAIHVKAKHIKDLAKLFLERGNDALFNPIKSVSKSYKPLSIPVYSNRNQYDCFYFGVKPQYFEWNDSYGPYIQNEQNMKAHLEFLKQVINAIPLTDFLEKCQVYRERTNEVVPVKLGGLTQPTLFQFETLHDSGIVR